ncbi:StsB family radical SAM/SPASM domain sactipeptide maturase [Kitasatospora viridis]|uniref:Radical SAM protein with 4Fe4S-binding SPASM domain n=1 Tax=Kitasatospora viridis TaxID=281105 RepID=A0A561UQ14_9ACTN|nr:StsB family radical SAM/SPASM domain sactipeptide maturase [Kitasatospora viridis]TWG01434.1 radical SAM protein with 4Fe4S-binding SPASM domain [Kitasatospora viridis]
MGLIDSWDDFIVPPDLVRFHSEGRRLLVNPEISAWCTPDDVQYAVLAALVDRERGAGAAGISPRDVERSLAYLLLHYVIYLPGREPRPVMAAPGLKLVYYAITDGCNLRCPYCYASSEKALPGELDTAESMALMDEIADLGATTVIFTGGEPMMRRDLFSVVRHARSLGLRTNIITNATLVRDSAVAEEMSEIFDLVTVSMDGSTEESHERTRGRGTFRKTLHALKLLNEHGVRPVINHVVGKDNAATMEQFAEFASGFDIRMVRVMQQSALGRGKEDDATYGWQEYLAGHAFTWTHPAAKHLLPEGPKAAKPCSVKGNCGMGGVEIYVNSLGNVYPCKLITAPLDIAGNVRTQKLAEIFADPVLAEMRESSAVLGGSVHTDCAECYIRAACGGGCRAYHMADSGSYRRNSRQLCRQLRHQMISSIWAAVGAGPRTLVEDPDAFSPYLVRTGELHPVHEDWKAELTVRKSLPLVATRSAGKGCAS